MVCALYCQQQTRQARTLVGRKLFYLFTCEYCFSHYIAVIVLIITRFQMLYTGWRGYLVSLFALVWVANQYMSIYNRLRLDIKYYHLEIQAVQKMSSNRKRCPESELFRSRTTKTARIAQTACPVARVPLGEG